MTAVLLLVFVSGQLPAEPLKEAPAGLTADLHLPGSHQTSGELSPWRLITSDEHGVTLYFEFAEPELIPVSGTGPGGALMYCVELAGCTRQAAEGEPDIPSLQLLCGVAQRGGVHLKVSEVKADYREDCHIAPVLTCREQQTGRRAEEALYQEYAAGRSYSQDNWQPAELVSLIAVEMLRDVRVARLLISPVQYHPVQRRLRWVRSFQLRISFDIPATRVERPAAGLFDWSYQVMLVNGRSACHWQQSLTDSAELAGQKSFFDRSAVWLKVSIESAGIYRISYEDLMRTGVNPRLIDPATFQLFTVVGHMPNAPYPDTMVEVALLVRNSAEGRFQPGDYLLFYGQSVSGMDTGGTRFILNPYTRENCYWLTWGSSQGKRMPQGLGTPLAGEPRRKTGLGFQHLELDRRCPARCGLLWVWELMEKSGNTSQLRTDYDLGSLYPGIITKLTAQLYSTTANNRLYVRLNNVLADSFLFNVNNWYDPFRFYLDSLRLVPDSSSAVVSLELVGSNSMTVMLDWFEVTVRKTLRRTRTELDFAVVESSPQTYSVSGITAEPVILCVDNPIAPNCITGYLYQGDSVVFRDVVSDTARYVVTDLAHLRRPLRIERRYPGRLRSVSADYLIIAPEHLYDAAQVLQRYRTEHLQGLPRAKVQTVRLTEIYDEFAYGRPEPIAIKDFLRRVRPAYGLLIGDATYDYRDILNLRPLPGVPPYEEGYSADPSGYSSASKAIDCWYADFDGMGATPDMYLGRITVRTPEEFRLFIEKLIAYEQGRYGLWCARGIAAADDEWLGYPPGYDRIGLDHIRASETIAALWGERFNTARIYLTEYPFVAYGDKPRAREELLRLLKSGALFFCYFGHGSGEAITHENLLGVQLVPSIVNDCRSPVALFASCAVGRWEDTRFECIAEEMARVPRGGAIAGIGASKATQPSSNLEFARTLFRLLLDSTQPTLGQAFAAALPSLTLYHLFGDPATRLPIVQNSSNPLFLADTLQCGRAYPFSTSLPFAQGWAASSLRGPLWLRTYNSPAPISRPSVTYILLGDEYYRGTARVSQYTLGGQFLIPTGVRRGTRRVADGSYIEVTSSTRFDVFAWNETSFLSLRKTNIVLESLSAAGSDREGPTIVLTVGGRTLRADDTASLPASFTLVGQLSDPSGILLCPVPAGDLFYLYVNDFKNRVFLADYFSYDLNSATAGSFRYPVSLTGGKDSIFVVAADNYGNRSTCRVYVRVQEETGLQLSELLVYPNPVRNGADFTFRLNRPAQITVKLFTISGRLLRTLHLPDGQAGFNTLYWDGRDEEGSRLGNGVYLYSIAAQALEPDGRRLSRAVRNSTFLVQR